MSQNSPANGTGVNGTGAAGSAGTAIAPSAADSANTSANTYDIEFFWDPI